MNANIGCDIFPAEGDSFDGCWVWKRENRADNTYVVKFGRANLYLEPAQIVALRDHLNAVLASDVTENVDAVAVVALHGDEVAE